jgi:hypothetical protein
MIIYKPPFYFSSCLQSGEKVGGEIRTPHHGGVRDMVSKFSRAFFNTQLLRFFRVLFFFQPTINLRGGESSHGESRLKNNEAAISRFSF